MHLLCICAVNQKSAFSLSNKTLLTTDLLLVESVLKKKIQIEFYSDASLQTQLL